MDRDFLGKLTLLYVEDDDFVRSDISSALKSIFKDVIEASNTDDAFNKFKNNKIDLIVSDINMPKKNGIIFLDEVKKIDSKIPFFFVTAHTDKEFLYSSLKLGVDDYFIKPLKIDHLLEKIEKTAKKVYQKKESDFYNAKIKEYLDVVGKVAVVFTFNSNYKITYCNDLLLEISKYSKEEILNLNFPDILDSDLSIDTINTMFDKLYLGEVYKENLQYITKYTEVYYTNTTIVPIKNEKGKIEKYICINFLLTEDEKEKREFKKKILYDYQETQRIYNQIQEKIQYLNLQIKEFEGSEKKQFALEKIKTNNKKFLHEISFLEEKIIRLKNKQDNFTSQINQKIKNISKATSRIKDYEIKSEERITKIKKEIKIREDFIAKIEKELADKSAKIEDLKEVLEHRKSQLQKKQ